MMDTGESHRRLPIFVKEELMNATILHESRGRIRLKLKQKRMTLPQADLLETWLQEKPWVRRAIVHERTCCVILYYEGDRQAMLDELRHFS